MTEPPRAAGDRLAEGWARKAYAVGFSGGRRDRGPLAEAGGEAVRLVGALERERGGLRALGFAPALPRSRPCGVLARWWASGASRFRDDGTPTGRWRAPRRGLGPRILTQQAAWMLTSEKEMMLA